VKANFTRRFNTQKEERRNRTRRLGKYSPLEFLFPSLLLRLYHNLFIDSIIQTVHGEKDEQSCRDISDPALERRKPKGRLGGVLALFLKSEKIPALIYVGKGPQYRHRSQITEGSLSTQALLLYVT
jgi:hypothetical protein